VQKFKLSLTFGVFSTIARYRLLKVTIMDSTHTPDIGQLPTEHW